jgi:hypothetical protein
MKEIQTAAKEIQTPRGGKRPGAGRPPSETIMERVTFQVSANDLRVLVTIAAKHEQSVSAYVRQAIDERINGNALDAAERAGSLQAFRKCAAIMNDTGGRKGQRIQKLLLEAVGE